MQCVFVRRRSERACPTQMIYSFATSPPLVYFHHQVLQEKEEEAAKGHAPHKMKYSFITSPPLVYFHHQVLQEKEEEAAKGMGRLTVGGEEMTWEGGEVANMVGGVI